MKIKLTKDGVVKGSVWQEGSTFDESYLTKAQMKSLIDQRRAVEVKDDAGHSLASTSSTVSQPEEKKDKKK